MKYALVVIEKPAGTVALAQSFWSDFLKSLPESEEPTERVARLSENVWLFDLQNATDSLAALVMIAQGCKLHHKVLYFAEPLAVFHSSESP